MNYEYYSQYDNSDNQNEQIEITQQQRRQRPDNEPPQNFPGQPPNVPSGPPPGFPGQLPPNVPGGPPPSFPGKLPPNVQGGPPPTFRIYPNEIRRCLYRYMYIWLRNGNSFWFYPLYLVDDALIGYRWNGYRWDYQIIRIRRILYYQCF